MILNYINYIPETMYYWGVNSKMQTSQLTSYWHTLCSRPNGTVLCKSAESFKFEIFEITIVR